MNLYQITGAMADVQSLIDDGVPMEQLIDTIKLIEADFNKKAESILYVLANIGAECSAIKSEETRLAERRKVKENAAARLKEYLQLNMQELNCSKVDNGVMTASIRKGASALLIENEEAIPQEFKKISTNVSIDKRGLLKALKGLEDGATIDGAQVVPGKSTLTIK